MLALRSFAILSLAQVQMLLENHICFDVCRCKLMIGFVGGKKGRKESVTTIKGLKMSLKKKLLSELNWSLSTHMATWIW